MKHFIMLLMAAACLSTQATRPMRQVINLKNGKQFVVEKKGCSCNYTARTFTQSKRRSFDTTSPDGLGIYGQSAHGTLPSIGDVEIRHFDLYRLQAEEELDDIGFDEYCGGEGITLIEWADLFMDRMPGEYLLVKIEREGTGRRAELTAVGAEYEEVLQTLKC